MNDPIVYLDDEEREIVEAFEDALEKGELISQLTPERKRELQQIAANTAKKTRNINIRISERDLHRLKVRAAEEGMPYQTLAASILHKATA